MRERERLELERRLREERAALLRQLRRVVPTPERAAKRLVAAPGDDGDAAVAGASADDDAAVAAHQFAELAEIDAALRLLDEQPDRFGTCSVCGGRIDPARLKIVPATRFCGRHAAAR
jgi:RNA polymerase-binding transcription factor DksA